MQKMKLDIQKFADGSIVIGTEIETDEVDEFLQNLPQEAKKQFDRMVDELEAKQPEIERLSQKYAELMTEYMEKIKPGKAGFMFESDIQDARELRKEIIAVVKELEKATGEKIIIPGIKDADTGIKNVGKGLQEVIKKVAKWSLLLFGVTRVITFVKNAISKIAQDDPQLKADLDYMKNALVYTMEPVVRGIVNLMKQLLIYVGYIVKMWTGKNIFENANKNLKSANKQAQEMQKTLAGFDEMNVLQDNKSSGAGATATPSFDLSNIEGMKMPGWVEFIGKNGQEIVAVILAIGSAIELLKLSKFLKDLKLIKTTLKATQALGIGIAIAGVALAIQDIVGFIKDPSWAQFLQILTDVGIVVGGIIMLTNPLMGIIVALASFVSRCIIDNWDAIAEVLVNVGSWIYKNVIKPVMGIIQEVIDFVGTLFNAFIEIWKVILGAVWGWIYDSVIKPIMDGVKTAFNWFNTNIIQPIVSIISSTIDFIITAFKNFIQVFKTVFIEMPKWIYTNVIKPIGDFFNGLWDGVKNKFSSVWDFIKKAFTKGGELFDGISEGIVNAFKTVVNFLIDGINFVIAIPFNTINGLLNTIRNVNIPIIDVKPFKGLWNENPLPVPQIPKLAKGGIINQPGRGVALGGENGMEGVIPLTDAQQMELLGEAIGKYISLNATIPIYVGNRQIAREMKRIELESNFAFNR